MALPFHNRVTLHGFHQEDFHLTWNISGLAGKTDAELSALVGKAVTLDATADNTVKLAGDGDYILGRISSVENRTSQGEGYIGAIEHRFSMRMPIAAGQTVARGATAVGAGNGFVKAAATPTPSINVVTAIETVNGQAYAVVNKF